jgi:hypothetical protein
LEIGYFIFVAFPVSHIVYAKKYLERHPAMDADLFLLGVLFPDIRRITDEISRYETHQIYKKLDLDFKDITAFRAGWKFHLWCDMRREEILNKNNFYKLSYTIDHDAPSKLLEDELVYEKYKNWEKLVLLLNNPPELEEEIPVSRETIARWFAIIAKYLEKKPDDKTIKAFLFKQRKLRKKSAEIIDVVRKLRENRKVVNILSVISEEILGK